MSIQVSNPTDYIEDEVKKSYKSSIINRKSNIKMSENNNSVVIPKITVQDDGNDKSIERDMKMEEKENLKINTNIVNNNVEKTEPSNLSPTKSVKSRISIKSRISNSFLNLKRKGSSRIFNSKSTNNFTMTPIISKRGSKSRTSRNSSKSSHVVPNANTTYTPNKIRGVSSKISMNSSPGENTYFSDASSAHSFKSSSTANSMFSALCNKKKNGAQKRLKRKDFSETIKELGSGATGNIHLVYRKGNPDKYYALKEFIIPKHKVSSESERKFFKHLQSEYTIGTLLHHRNVIEVENFIYNDYYKRNRKQRHVYQVMEYCDGGDLFDIIQSGKITQGDIICYFKQLIEGLAYIHSMGVAHRDLKPENIMFKGNKTLKILDFGAAIMFRTPYSDEIIRCSGIVGSEPYMAPEQFSLKPYDPRTVDIWSCGIIFLAMFYNELPWKSAILSNNKYKLWAEKGISEIINDLPNGPKQLITKMLEPDPDKRITIEGIFKDKWFSHAYCCQEHDNGIIDYHRYNYPINYSPSDVNSYINRNTSDLMSNTSYIGRPLTNKNSSIKFSDGVLSSDNSMEESDEIYDINSIKGHTTNTSEKTKVGDESFSLRVDINQAKKAVFTIDTDSDEESSSPISSSDITKNNNSGIKENEEMIKEEDDEELKSLWGLELKCSHEKVLG